MAAAAERRCPARGTGDLWRRLEEAKRMPGIRRPSTRWSMGMLLPRRPSPLSRRESSTILIWNQTLSTQTTGRYGAGFPVGYRAGLEHVSWNRGVWLGTRRSPGEGPRLADASAADDGETPSMAGWGSAEQLLEPSCSRLSTNEPGEYWVAAARRGERCGTGADQSGGLHR